jgi:hypothetical protein
MSYEIVVEENNVLLVDIDGSGSAAVAAAESEDAAAASATAAHTSELNASDSAAAALASQQAAHASELNASDSAAAALASKQAAATSEQNASDSKAAALASQQAAATSEQNASDSKAAALASQQAAHTSELNASDSAAAALGSQQAAHTSELNAADSATAAQGSANSVNGYLELDVSAADVTLDAAQAGNGIMKFKGALTGNRTVTLPATTHPFIVENATTGIYTLTIAATGKVPAAQVLQGKSSSLFCDGTGIYATSATTGVQFAGETPITVDTTLDLSHLGRLVVQTVAGKVTTLPKANTYPKGAGIGVKTQAAASIAIQAGDTAELVMPFGTAVHDFFFWESDGVSNWRLAWWNNAFTPAFQTSVTAPKLLAGMADNGVDAVQAAGSISSTGASGLVRLVGSTGASVPAKLTAIAYGLALEAATASAIVFNQNSVESMRLSPGGRLLIGTQTDDGASALQVNGVIRSTTGGIKYPDGTVQTTALGISQSTKTFYTVGATDAVGTFAEGDTQLRTSGYVWPYVTLHRNGMKLFPGLHFSNAADSVHLNILDVPCLSSDEFAVEVNVPYNASTVYAPQVLPLAPAAGASFIPYVHTPGFAFLMSTGLTLTPGVSYNSRPDGSGFDLLGWTVDTNSDLSVFVMTPVTIADVLLKSQNLADLQNKATARQNLGVGRTLLKTVNLAAVSQVVLTDADFGGYDKITVEFEAMTTTASYTCTWKVAPNTDGSGGPGATAYTTSMQYSWANADNSGGSTNANNRAIAYGRWMYNSTGVATGNGTAEITFSNLQNQSGQLGVQAMGRCVTLDAGGNLLNGNFGTFVGANLGPIKNITFAVDTGTMSGKMIVYGHNS